MPKTPDAPTGEVQGKADTEKSLRLVELKLNQIGYDASRVIGPSQSDATVDLIQGRGPYDAILIDGDHTYEGVKADWLRYQGMGRIIAFHDIVGTGQREKPTGREVEVPILWQEIKAQGFHTVEYVGPGSKMGIGVVFQN